MRLRSAAWSVLLLVAIASSGCRRKPEFIPAGSDSTAVGSGADSTSIRLRLAQSAWEAGASAEAAASVAAVLADRLAARPLRRWPDETEFLLDSLGVGAETGASDSVLAVNFFSRSDPASGSWPYVFWLRGDAVLQQAVEGKGLHLFTVTTRDSAIGGRRGLAALFGSRGAGGQQPLLMVWGLTAKNEWNLAQTLGADSLGGVGTGDFEAVDDTTELIARTYRPPRYFEECATCPHVYRVHRFRWRPGGFERSDLHVVPSPYSTFVQFIQALMAGDRAVAASFTTHPDLVDQAERQGWNTGRTVWRIAPAMDESPGRMVFFRGEKEAYSVQFASHDQSWLIAGFEPVSRSLE